jgi:hypothetical protein
MNTGILMSACICFKLFTYLYGGRMTTSYEFLYFFYCCAVLGYIVAFTKVLTKYQKYYNWIHPLHHSPPSPHSWNSFSRYHFPFTYTLHSIYTIFTLPHLYPPRQDQFSCPVLRFCKRKRMTFFCLFVYDSYTGSFLVTPVL